MLRDNWQQIRLGDFVTLQRGHDLPEHSRQSGTVPVVGSFGVTGYHSEPKAKGPGVTVGRSGASFGVVSYSKGDFWPLNTALYVVDFHGNHERFAYYLLRSLDLKRFNSGSAQPSLNRNFIHPISVKIPPYSEQRSIGDLLGALDDKVELNQRTNETLEGIVRTIFKSWFVDFDPVRAKAAGRRASSPTDLSELFPVGFQDSELGPIPRGWSIKTIEEVADRVGMGPFGASIKVETFVPKGVPIISGQHLRRFVLEDSAFNFITEEHAERLAAAVVKQGDVVFTHAGNIGQAAIVPPNSRYQKYIISQRQFFMRCDPLQISPIFAAVYFTSPEGQQTLLANASSSGVPSIARPVTYLRSIRLIVPPKPVVNAFDGLVQPFISKLRQNDDENESLTKLGEFLLPRLMSGEVKLRA